MFIGGVGLVRRNLRGPGRVTRTHVVHQRDGVLQHSDFRSQRNEETLISQRVFGFRSQGRPALGNGLIDRLQTLLKRRRRLRIDPGALALYRFLELGDSILEMLFGQSELRFNPLDGIRLRRVAGCLRCRIRCLTRIEQIQRCANNQQQ